MIIIDFSRGKHDFLFPVAGISDGFASHSLSQAKSGTHSPSPTGSHTAAYTPKHGPSGRGRYHYPRHELHVHEHPRAGYQNGVFCRFLVLPGVLLKNAESLRDSDAFMRVAVPQASRPRWAAHTYAVNTSIFPAEFFSHSQKAGKKSHSLMFHIHVFDRTA